MAYNEQLADKLRAALEHVPNVEEKKMFRGIAFMVNGKMCINVGDDELMIRVDPALHDELLETQDCRTVKMGGRSYKGYLLVAHETLKTKKDWDFWLQLALDFNPRAKASPKRKKKV